MVGRRARPRGILRGTNQGYGEGKLKGESRGLSKEFKGKAQGSPRAGPRGRYAVGLGVSSRVQLKVCLGLSYKRQGRDRPFSGVCLL